MFTLYVEFTFATAFTFAVVVALTIHTTLGAIMTIPVVGIGLLSVRIGFSYDNLISSFNEYFYFEPAFLTKPSLSKTERTFKYLANIFDSASFPYLILYIKGIL